MEHRKMTNLINLSYDLGPESIIEELILFFEVCKAVKKLSVSANLQKE